MPKNLQELGYVLRCPKTIPCAADFLISGHQTFQLELTDIFLFQLPIILIYGRSRLSLLFLGLFIVFNDFYIIDAASLGNMKDCDRQFLMRKFLSKSFDADFIWITGI